MDGLRSCFVARKEREPYGMPSSRRARMFGGKGSGVVFDQTGDQVVTSSTENDSRPRLAAAVGRVRRRGNSPPRTGLQSPPDQAAGFFLAP